MLLRQKVKGEKFQCGPKYCIKKLPNKILSSIKKLKNKIFNF